jgi:CheY-like chemotaxis protein
LQGLEPCPRAEKEPVVSGHLTAKLQGLRVLVVDDDIDTRELLMVALKHYGAEVRAVASAAEAIDAVSQWLPDVLISDVGMPERDGYALIQQVRLLGSENGGGVPALALTAFAGDEHRSRALLAGFQIHMAKPIDPIELATVVASLAKKG